MKKTVALLLICILTVSLVVVSVIAAEAAGSYNVNADLSCYVNAMGGVEFGRPLLTGAELIVAENGSEYIQLHFTKSSVTIYSVTCDTFIDPDPDYKTNDRGVMSGTIGIYDANGSIVTDGVSYTLSDDTALNAKDEAVHYVDSITYPIDSRRSEYHLTLYINSNVMGVQFTNPNNQATAATYSATLTVDWNSLSNEGAADTPVQDENTPVSNADEDDMTLPPSTASSETEAQTQAPSTASESITQMDGLNIHRVGSNETEQPTVSSPDSVIAKRAYLNIPALIVIACVGAAVFIAGLIVTILSARKYRKLEDDSVENNEN